MPNQTYPAPNSPNQGYPAQNYPNPAYAAPNSPTPDGSGPVRRIPDNRGVIKLILLSILTCGIYGFYTVYSMARDLNEMCRDDDENTGGLFAYILLCFLTCGIYDIYWEYKMGNRIARNAPRFGLTVVETGGTIVLWRLVGILFCGIGTFYGTHLLMKNMNLLARAYNNAHGLV